MSKYSRLNQSGQGHTPADLNNMPTSYPGYVGSEAIPLKSNATGNWRPVDSEQDSNEYQNSIPQRPTWKSFGRADTGKSKTSSFAASSPWEHKLNEKHLKSVLPASDTVRYFDRSRQTRRVFIECLLMWFGTFFICAALAGTMYGFSKIESGMSRFQKYGYNALVTGLSILLGLAFSAQFKQYAEMMRWRFLASEYRTLHDFELVLGCDSYRNTMSLIFGGNTRGTWYPSKTQVLALFWFLIFVFFNIFGALLGLTYSIDVSDTATAYSPGLVSVADLNAIGDLDNIGTDDEIPLAASMAEVNLWGELGLSFYESIINQPNGTNDWVYKFVDGSTNAQNKQIRNTTREIKSSAECVEYEVVYGGYANFDDPAPAFVNQVGYVNPSDNETYSIQVENVAIGATTWIGNMTSAENVTCGPRCAQFLVLQSANNCTNNPAPDAPPDNCTSSTRVQFPRLWSCTNVVGQVSNTDSSNEGFDNPQELLLPDLQARVIAGAPGWSGVLLSGTGLQQGLIFRGENDMNAPGNITVKGMEELVQYFTALVFATADGVGFRKSLTGAYCPGPAQVVNVKWRYASLILIGIPVVQFLMLLGVVWFSGKAIILEPSYLAAAHLLQPVLNRIGEAGTLLSVDEMGEKLGKFKIAYGVRPDPADPGHSDTTFVRDLAVIEESEGFGYIRGKMPEGRYD